MSILKTGKSQRCFAFSSIPRKKLYLYNLAKTSFLKLYSIKEPQNDIIEV